MKCPLCGHEHADDTVFCPNTGKRIPAIPPAERLCPSCGAIVEPGWGACPKCGARLRLLSDPTVAGTEQPHCPSCNAAVKPEWGACPYCGLIFPPKEPAPVPPPPEDKPPKEAEGGEKPGLAEEETQKDAGAAAEHPTGEETKGELPTIIEPVQEDTTPPKEPAPPPAPPQELRCPRCNEPIQPEWKKCRSCGKRLQQTYPKWLPYLLGAMGVATIALIALLLLKPGGGTSSLATQVPTTYLGPAATFTPPSAATATQAATLPPTATRTPSPIPTDTPTATPPYPPPVTPTLAITFAIEMPSQIREAGAFNAMAFDSSGTPYLVFNKGNPDLGGPFDKDQLYYAFRQSNSAWISREITNGAKNEGFSNALAADASGNLHLATYSYEDQIIYYSVRRRGAAGWDSLRPLASVLRGKDAAGSSNVPPPVSIAVSPNGTAHIAYFDYVNERLMYISTAGGGAREVASGLSAEGGSFPIVVDAEGRPVIAFYNPISTAQNKAGLQVARLTGSAWKYETVAANPSGSAAKVGLQPALATDEQGYVYLAYFDGYESALMLTVYDGTGWQPPILVDDQGGQYTKMAVDSQSGTVHLAYYQKNALTLNYAAGNASAFAEPKVILSDVPLIDENKKEAKHLALALDARGNPWISFFDPDDMLLKVFRPAAP